MVGIGGRKCGNAEMYGRTRAPGIRGASKGNRGTDGAFSRQYHRMLAGLK